MKIANFEINRTATDGWIGASAMTRYEPFYQEDVVMLVLLAV